MVVEVVEVHVTDHAKERARERFGRNWRWVLEMALIAYDTYHPQPGPPEVFPVDSRISVVMEVQRIGAEEHVRVVTIRRRNLGDWRFIPE